MRRPRITLISFLIACSFSGNDGWGDESADTKLASMRERAQSMTVGFVDDRPAAADVTLISEPLFRYSDQPRGIIDGSFWCWQSDHRPVAFQKIEYYDRPEESLRWFYCFASASGRRIQAAWKVGENWSATEPGIKLQPLVDEPLPAEIAFRISFQIKKISRRFSVRLDDRIANTGEQLRLLDKPIHQYGDPESDAMGAVFGFASNGTNPDALLLVELAREDSGKTWKYGWIQMTTGKLTAQLDQQVVWTAPFRNSSFDRPTKFESWLYFYESSAGK